MAAPAPAPAPLPTDASDNPTDASAAAAPPPIVEQSLKPSVAKKRSSETPKSLASGIGAAAAAAAIAASSADPKPKKKGKKKGNKPKKMTLAELDKMAAPNVPTASIRSVHRPKAALSLREAIRAKKPKEKPKQPLYIKWKEVVDRQQLIKAAIVGSGDEKAAEEVVGSSDELKYVTIVSISDTHMQHRQLKMPKADILVISGDFVRQYATAEEATQVNIWIGELIAEGIYKKCVAIAGNHEGYDCPILTPKELGQIMTNTVFLSDSAATVEGIKFYGTPWCCNLHDVPHNTGYHKDRQLIRPYFDKIPNDVQYLVTHMPPQGILDAIKGSPVLRQQLTRLKALRVMQYGHCHNGYGYKFVTRQSLVDSIVDPQSDNVKNDDLKGSKLHKYKIAELKSILKMDKKKKKNAVANADNADNDAVEDLSDIKLPSFDLIDEMVLFINAANDAGGTTKNPEQPDQPIWFRLPLRSKT